MPCAEAFFPASRGCSNCVSTRFVSLPELGASCYPCLLFVGSNQPKNNLYGLLETWQSLRSVFSGLHVVVRACLNPRQSEKLHNDIGKNLIEFQENLSEKNLFDLLGHAEALVLPSFHEGYGLPVIEALAAGTPVCVSAEGAMAEVAGPAGFFDPTDHASIARACAKVSQQRPKSDPVWRDRCRQQVERFDSDVVISQLLVFIRRVLKFSEIPV